MVDVLAMRSLKDDYIVNINKGNLPLDGVQCIVHDTPKGGGYILQTEWHTIEMAYSMVRSEWCFLTVGMGDFNMPIAASCVES